MILLCSKSRVAAPPVSAPLSNRVQMGFAGDGPTYTLANEILQIPWVTPAGDFDGPVATISIPSAGTYTIDLTDQVALCLIENTGLLVKSSVESRVVRLSGVLTVITTTNGPGGEVVPLLTVATGFCMGNNYMSLGIPSSGQDYATNSRFPWIMKHDYSALAGTLVSASFQFQVAEVDSPATYYFVHLNPPEFNTDVTTLGAVDPGVRGEVAEADLAADPRILFYSNVGDGNGATEWPISWGAAGQNHDGNVAWPEYGIMAHRLRSRNGGLTVTMLAASRLITPVTELYMAISFLTEIGFGLGNAGGIKLPGFDYSDFEGLGGGISASFLNHHGKSSVNNGAMRLDTYDYDQAQYDDPQWGGLGRSLYQTGLYIREGTKHTLELHVKLNTPGLSDGIIERKCDGVLLPAQCNYAANIRGSNSNVVLDKLTLKFFAGGPETDVCTDVYVQVGPYLCSLTDWPGPMALT